MSKKNQYSIWQVHSSNITSDNIIENYNNPAVFQKELSDFVNKYISENKKEIIEVGCESAVTSMLLDNDFNKTALDIVPDIIQKSKKASEILNKKINFIIGDMFNMPFANSRFDIVFNSGVIEHFNKEQRTAALKEYKRVLKDDGYMVIAFPNHYSFPYRFSYITLKLFKKWKYPNEYKIYNLEKEIIENDLKLEARIIMSKSTVLKWVDFFRPLYYLFKILDKIVSFEGYLTVLVIRKKN